MVEAFCAEVKNGTGTPTDTPSSGEENQEYNMDAELNCPDVASRSSNSIEVINEQHLESHTEMDPTVPNVSSKHDGDEEVEPAISVPGQAECTAAHVAVRTMSKASSTAAATLATLHNFCVEHVGVGDLYPATKLGMNVTAGAIGSSHIEGHQGELDAISKCGINTEAHVTEEQQRVEIDDCFAAPSPGASDYAQNPLILVPSGEDINSISVGEGFTCAIASSQVPDIENLVEALSIGEDEPIGCMRQMSATLGGSGAPREKTSSRRASKRLIDAVPIQIESDCDASSPSKMQKTKSFCQQNKDKSQRKAPVMKGPCHVRAARSHIVEDGDRTIKKELKGKVCLGRAQNERRLIRVPKVLASPSFSVSMPGKRHGATNLEKEIYCAIRKKSYPKGVGIPYIARIGRYWVDEKNFSEQIRARQLVGSDIIDVYCEAMNCDQKSSPSVETTKYCLTSDAIVKLKAKYFDM